MGDRRSRAAAALEVGTNVILVIVAIGIGWALWLNQAPVTTTSTSVLGRTVSVYQRGDKLEPIPGVQFPAPTPTLFVVIRKDCRYCTDSMSFYRRLLQERPPATRVVVIAPDPPAALRAYLKSHQFEPDLAVGAARLKKVRTTPTLILANSKGLAEYVWTGQLDKAGEAAVIDALMTGPAAKH